jgi:type I restriction enzyme, R subunit
MLVEANLGTEENYEKAREFGLGLFVRSLVGLDRQAALKAFEGFLRGRDLSANQQQFVAMIIEELTRTGVMDAGRLFETPYVDFAASGVQNLFGSEGVVDIRRILDSLRNNAIEIVDA